MKGLFQHGLRGFGRSGGVGQCEYRHISPLKFIPGSLTNLFVVQNDVL